MYLKKCEKDFTFRISSIRPRSQDANDDDSNHDDSNGRHHGNYQIHVRYDVHYGILNTATAATAVIVLSTIGDLARGSKGTCKKQQER